MTRITIVIEAEIDEEYLTKESQPALARDIYHFMKPLLWRIRGISVKKYGYTRNLFIHKVKS